MEAQLGRSGWSTWPKIIPAGNAVTLIRVVITALLEIFKINVAKVWG